MIREGTRKHIESEIVHYFDPEDHGDLKSFGQVVKYRHYMNEIHQAIGKSYRELDRQGKEIIQFHYWNSNQNWTNTARKFGIMKKDALAFRDRFAKTVASQLGWL